MRKLLLSIILVVSFVFAKAQTAQTVKVIRIYDGDTFTAITEQNETIRVRLNGIDAPERTQDLGLYARECLVALIGDKLAVTIVPIEEDFYGRIVCTVYNLDGLDVSAEMIRAGMAWYYYEYCKNEEYEKLEAAAKKEGIGVHANPWAIRPSKYRKLTKIQRKTL